jgi:hypothetical protein
MILVYYTYSKYLFTLVFKQNQNALHIVVILCIIQATQLSLNFNIMAINN